MNEKNVTKFEEKIEEYINKSEVIIFEEDVALLSIINELIIKKDIELISLNERKLKINCPQSGKRLFHIK